jgi:nucleotide-binding universal stress UspA family protein
MEINKILVGFDGSPCSKKALVYAKYLSRKLQAAVTIVSVVRLPEFSQSLDEVEEIMDEEGKRIGSLHREIAADARQEGIDMSTLIIHGHPVEKIIQYAQENKFDLIVLGTRGLGGFKKLMIGSVAEKVVSYSKIPVMVIRE